MAREAKVTIEIPIAVNSQPSEHIEGVQGLQCRGLNDLLFGSLGRTVSERQTQEAFNTRHDNPQALHVTGA